MTAFIDFLVDRDEVDPERIALVGSSMGGYFAVAVRPSRGGWQPRSAEVPSTASRPAPQGDDSRRRVDQAMAMFAVNTVEELLEKIQKFNLEGVDNQIHIYPSWFFTL